jgi:hypothetical protein
MPAPALIRSETAAGSSVLLSDQVTAPVLRTVLRGSAAHVALRIAPKLRMRGSAFSEPPRYSE